MSARQWVFFVATLVATAFCIVALMGEEYAKATFFLVLTFRLERGWLLP